MTPFTPPHRHSSANFSLSGSAVEYSYQYMLTDWSTNATAPTYSVAQLFTEPISSLAGTGIDTQFIMSANMGVADYPDGLHYRVDAPPSGQRTTGNLHRCLIIW